MGLCSDPRPRKGAAPLPRANGLRDLGAAPQMRRRPERRRAGKQPDLRQPRRIPTAAGGRAGSGGDRPGGGGDWGREGAGPMGVGQARAATRSPGRPPSARPSYRQIWMADGVSAAGPDMVAAAAAGA